MVECFLAKEDVAGSTPVSRSKQHLFGGTLHLQLSFLLLWSQTGARYPSGKGEVCKTFMRRFDPGPRLQYLNDLPAPEREAFVRWLGLILGIRRRGTKYRTICAGVHRCVTQKAASKRKGRRERPLE